MRVTMASTGHVTGFLAPQISPRMEQVARRVTARAKAYAPVDTGRLRASIRWWRRGKTGQFARAGEAEIVAFEVQASTPYAGFQEFGFRHWRSGRMVQGRFYLTRALLEERRL